MKYSYFSSVLSLPFLFFLTNSAQAKGGDGLIGLLEAMIGRRIYIPDEFHFDILIGFGCAVFFLILAWLFKPKDVKVQHINTDSASLPAVICHRAGQFSLLYALFFGGWGVLVGMGYLT